MPNKIIYQSNFMNNYAGDPPKDNAWLKERTKDSGGGIGQVKQRGQVFQKAALEWKNEEEQIKGARKEINTIMNKDEYLRKSYIDKDGQVDSRSK
jgi:hypothetical protein